MIHQIILVGGQMLPLLIGIKEFNPDCVHFIASSASQERINFMVPFLAQKTYTINICDSHDFNSIKSACTSLLSKSGAVEDFQINLTGGTKIMLLAAHSLVIEKKLTGFYINQNETYLSIPEYTSHKLSCKLSVKEVLELSGHTLGSHKVLADFSHVELKAVDTIGNFADNFDKILQQLQTNVRKTYGSLNALPEAGQLELANRILVTWSPLTVEIKSRGSVILTAESHNIRSLFFYASWWELAVALEVSKWTRPNELLIQCEFPFRSNLTVQKNEIDILVNLGGKLIFIECKSGIVKPEDINKMKAIKDTYGGVVAKSLLVCRYKPEPTIMEKCVELGINTFYLFDQATRINSLSNLTQSLDELVLQLSL